MAEFEKAISRVPIAIRDVTVILVDYAAIGAEPAHQTARYDAQVEYNTGEIVARHGDLVPHITLAQINALKAFIAGLRVQAVTQILP